jgi:transcriptional regulator GlxA family with amidase domain
MKSSQQLLPPTPPRTIVFLAAPSTQILDVAGPFQVFVRAAELFVQEYPAQKIPYKVVLASSTRRRSVATNCGLVLTGTETYHTLRGAIDTLLVAGGTGVENAARDEELLLWLQKTAQRVRRVGSICTGAFLLASAGLLDGKRAATHWKWAAELANKFKHTTVDPDPIYIRDGNTYTTAGVTAGMDLALALVEEDLGSSMALKVARELVLYLRRAGGQSQFSAALSLQSSDRKQIEEIRSWALDNLDQSLSVEKLAAKSGMSPRNFARVFLKDRHDPRAICGAPACRSGAAPIRGIGRQTGKGCERLWVWLDSESSPIVSWCSPRSSDRLQTPVRGLDHELISMGNSHLDPRRGTLPRDSCTPWRQNERTQEGHYEEKRIAEEVNRTRLYGC